MSRARARRWPLIDCILILIRKARKFCILASEVQIPAPDSARPLLRGLVMALHNGRIANKVSHRRRRRCVANELEDIVFGRRRTHTMRASLAALRPHNGCNSNCRCCCLSVRVVCLFVCDALERSLARRDE